MRALIQKLLLTRVKPYYLYQCDLIAGSAHLRSSVRRGLEIMDSVRRRSSPEQIGSEIEALLSRCEKGD